MTAFNPPSFPAYRLAGPAADPTAAPGPYGGELIPINNQAGTTYTLGRADVGTYILFTSASAVTVTVPSDPTGNVPKVLEIGSQITMEQHGAGQITVAGDGGAVVINGIALTSAAQYAVIALTKVGANLWTLAGAVTGA